MSIYSLENQSAFNYFAKHREFILQFSDRKYIRSHFLVGEKQNEEEEKFSHVMYGFLCTKNCELINYIDKKLRGKLEPVKAKPLNIIETDNGRGDVYNITQIIGEGMEWEDTQW